MDKIKKIAEPINAILGILSVLVGFANTLFPNLLKMNPVILNFVVLFFLMTGFLLYRWGKADDMKKVREEIESLRKEHLAELQALQQQHTADMMAIHQRHEALILELDQYLGGVTLRVDDWSKPDDFTNLKYGSANTFQTVNVYNIMYRMGRLIEGHLKSLYKMNNKDILDSDLGVSNISKIRGKDHIMPNNFNPLIH